MEDYLNKIYTQEDIDNFISTNAEETINLDFKRCEALHKLDKKTSTPEQIENAKLEIAKDLSAMANSDGGLLIYGIEEIEKYKAGGLSFINGKKILKEQLEQIINSRIQRKIENLKIDVIRYDDNIEQSIFIFKIPRSLNAPHMTLDKKFYKRYNFQSVQMEEYEIRNLYSRKEKTELKILDPTIKGEITGDSGILGIWHYNININTSIMNVSKEVETLFKIEYMVEDGQSIKELKSIEYIIENNYRIYKISNTSPLFQNESVKITLNVHITKNTFKLRKLPIKVKLYYTHGMDEISINIWDKIINRGKILSSQDFRGE